MSNAPTTPTTADRLLPPEPEREGYHWVRRFRGADPIPLHWFPDWHRNAVRGWGKWSQPDREYEWEYIGPCPKPVAQA